MRVLVLGGTGFIGRRVTEQLVAARHEVTALHRGRNPAPLGAASVRVESSAPEALREALAVAAPQVLIHMIAYRESDAEELISPLPFSAERLVVISSGDVYATYGAFLGHQAPLGAGEPVTESGELRSRLFPYREQSASETDLRFHYEKILVERRLRQLAPVPVTVLRLPMVYGVGDPQRRVQAVVGRLRENPDLLTINADEADWSCTRGYVEDVAFGIALAATDRRATGETFNLGEADPLTEQQWIAAIGRETGWRGRVVADPRVPPSLPARWDVPLTVSTTKIRRELGFREPVGRTEGIRRSVK